jgi:DNA-binding CsgD family transcriptional regulator
MRHGLSEREADVLMLVAQGHRNNEIAESLTISIRTVERHLENIFAKMGVRNRTEAVIEAARTGLLGEVA